ncbi:MAG: PDDEXK nuclease domain-containing protein [Paludibacteraceae bacterium]|nr:PDDEXK nuclease domain-containing protein [Paludibacteraceae bacterium]
MADKNNTTPLTPQLMQDFQQVYCMILSHRKRAAAAVDNEMLLMIWQVGGYVSMKLKSSAWGDGVVRQLSDYIRTQDPTSRGWSYRTIYKMVQLYDSYSRSEFTELVSHMNVNDFARPQLTVTAKTEIVPIEMAQIGNSEIVPIELAQIPNVLFATGWSNHQMIMSRCKTDEERLFYMLYAKRERLEYKQLERAIKTDTMTSLLSAREMQSEALQATYPDSRVLFKDTAYVDFLGLPKKYKESKLRKGIIDHMKQFVLEIGGRDFLFIDDEHVLKVNGKPYKCDLLFYHRLLQCMVAFELKTTEFRPSYKGQLEFYLEVLDQEEKYAHENPTIGIIFCKESDPEVVRYAMNRTMSPMMVMQYKEQLKVGGVIQRCLEEYCRFVNEVK